MKKRKTSFILATALAASIIMSGCASTAVSGSDSSSTATEESATVETALDIDYSAGLKKDGHYAGVKAKNIVTLPDDYDHMTFKTEDLHMEDGTLDSALLQIKQTYGEHTTVDRAAQEGDCVTVDYTGSYNGDEFPNGSAKDAEIVLGQGSYVDGFESQIEGHFAGEKFDITVTFPDSYPDTTDSEGNTLSLAGQDVQFRIELKDVSELTLTDDSIVNCFGDNKYYTEDGTLVTSVDTFKQYYNELLTKDALGLAIYNYMMDNSVVSEIPQSLIDDQRDTYRKEIETSAENMGKTMDEYLETTDYDTEDTLLDSYNDRIEESVKAYLVFQAVAEAEKIKVTDADVSDYFGDDSLSVQQAQKYYGEEYVNQTVLYNKVGDWLTAHATIA